MGAVSPFADNALPVLHAQRRALPAAGLGALDLPRREELRHVMSRWFGVESPVQLAAPSATNLPAHLFVRTLGPLWKKAEDPDWSMWNSTVMLAQHPQCSEFPVQIKHHWGLLVLDSACNADGMFGWNASGPAQATSEATNAAMCVLLKEAGLAKRCGIYHNLELSLQWLESNRNVMDEEHVRKGWFLQYKNGSVFHHNIYPGWQWTIDWRNPDAFQYFVRSIVNATQLPGVDVTFSDDREGVPNEHPETQHEVGMSDKEVADLQFATQSGGQYLALALARANRTCWDCIGGTQGRTNQGGPPRNASQCASHMRSLCQPKMRSRGMFMEWDGASTTLAAFLITRPPIAFLGGRLADVQWDQRFALDVGEPADGAVCEETEEGVFSRRWTKGTVALDCRNFTAQLPFGPLADSGKARAQGLVV